MSGLPTTSNADAESKLTTQATRAEVTPAEPASIQPHAGVQPAWLRSPVLWVVVIGLVLAALFARQALLHINVGAVGGNLDGYNNIWGYYWLKTDLFDLHRNPYYTNYIYYPTGISLRFHTFNPLNGLLTMPGNLTLGYVPTFNLIFFFAPVLTLLFSFLLIRDLLYNPWAAFAGAVVATYTDYHIPVFLTVGQSSYITLQWVPLYFFFLFRAIRGKPIWSQDGRLLDRDTRPWPVYVGLSILALVLTTLTDWQYLMFIVFATLVYGAVVLFTRQTVREKATIFGKLAAIGGIYTAIVAIPLVLPMIKEAQENPWLDVSYQSALHSIDVSWLLSPGIGLHGAIILLVALLGLWTVLRLKQSREAGIYWLVTVVFFYFMALGPELRVNGTSTGVPLLYTLMEKVPVISSGRDPARFSLIATIGMGVLFAFGISRILDLMQTRFQIKTRVISALIVLVLLATPISNVMAYSGEAQINPPDIPPFYQQLANDKQSYAILELPIFSDTGRGADVYQMYQIVHNKVRYSGRLARDRKLTNPNNFVKRASLFRHLWLLQFPKIQEEQEYPDKDILKATDLASQGIPILNYYNTPYIIMYKEAMTPDNWARAEGLLHQVLGKDATPYYEDNIMRVYKVPQASPPSNAITLDVGEGWSSREIDPNGTPFRWADDTGSTSQVYTMNLDKQPVHAVLKFAAFTYKVPRTLQVSINGAEAVSVQISPEDRAKQISVDLILPSGNNLFEFSSPEPALPTDNPATDNRHLSFAVENLTLEVTP